MTSKDLKKESQDILKQLQKPLANHRELLNQLSHWMVYVRKSVKKMEGETASVRNWKPPTTAEPHIKRADALQKELAAYRQEAEERYARLKEQSHSLARTAEQNAIALKQAQVAIAGKTAELDALRLMAETISFNGISVQLWSWVPLEDLTALDVMRSFVTWLESTGIKTPQIVDIDDTYSVGWIPVSITQIVGLVMERCSVDRWRRTVANTKRDMHKLERRALRFIEASADTHSPGYRSHEEVLRISGLKGQT